MTPEDKKELTKKIVAVIALIVFAGFGWAGFFKAPVKKPVKTAAKIEKKAVSSKVKEPSKTTQKAKKRAVFEISYIHSSDKTQIIKLAAQNIGKKDPFINNHIQPKKSEMANSSFKSSSKMNMMPSFQNFFDLSGLKTMISLEPQLKGFIGNKAIINYKGTNKALKENEIFKDLKILNVAPDKLSVKYIKKGKIHFKQLKLPNNNDFGIIR